MQITKPITKTKVVIMQAISGQWLFKILFGSQILGFLKERDVENWITGVLQGAI